MNELLDKQVNAQKESLKNTSRVHASSCMQAHEKCAMKMKQRKNDMHKNVFGGRREIIGLVWQTHAMDINEFQVYDC